ncbi:MAG TPA: carbohydrate kinase [Chloroflexi bacterium]|nr:carbohydrate kinase [Chloroflexota bacterium]
MSTYLLGIDIGTTAVKAILADDEGHIIAEESAQSTLHSTQPGWAEEDAGEWWRNTGAVCQSITAAHPDKPVAAVGVSGMVPTLVVVGEDGTPLRFSIQQNDARAHAEIEYFQSQTDADDILARTGSPVTSQSIGPKLLWLWKHEPEIMARARHIMGSYDYINFRLTGELSIEQNWALESGLYDLHRRDWDDDLLRLSRIDSGWLGTVHAPSDLIGRVTPEAAWHTGLRAGTPVVAGSADHVASAFAAGLEAPGDLLVKLGGAGDILFVLDELRTDPRLFIDYHLIPGQYLINGCMAASGSIIKWFRNQFAPEATYAELDAEAAEVPAGAEGLLLLPYFIGEKTPIFDPLARGLLFGLTLGHTRAHVFRAILEAISFGFYHHLQVLEEMGFHPGERVMVTNGGARSALWKQITADVLNLRLHVLARHPGSSLGAMFVAGMGIGAFEGWSQIERYLLIESVIEPNPEHHALYRRQFELYRALYEANRGLFPRLLTLTGPSE